MCRINFNMRRGENVQTNDPISQLEETSKSQNLVELLSVTPGAEEVISYCARVSNPNNQLNFNNNSKLISYLIKNQHWSPFEMAHMTLQIKTSRGISPQILRHRSFTFQEFSQRYAAVDSGGVVLYAARRQDVKNRQNSVDDLAEEVKQEWHARQQLNWKQSFEHYTWALDNGIAKECARFVLPLGCSTTLYMSGSIRSWIHYIELRSANGTQEEHKEIAVACKDIFKTQLPSLAAALNW